MQEHRVTEFAIHSINPFTHSCTTINRGAVTSVPFDSRIAIIILHGEDTFIYNMDYQREGQFAALISRLSQEPFIAAWYNPYEPIKIVCQAIRHHINHYNH